MLKSGRWKPITLLNFVTILIDCTFFSFVVLVYRWQGRRKKHESGRKSLDIGSTYIYTYQTRHAVRKVKTSWLHMVIPDVIVMAEVLLRIALWNNTRTEWHVTTQDARNTWWPLTFVKLVKLNRKKVAYTRT